VSSTVCTRTFHSISSARTGGLAGERDALGEGVRRDQRQVAHTVVDRAGEADDLGVPGRQSQYPVAVAAEQQRHPGLRGGGPVLRVL